MFGRRQQQTGNAAFLEDFIPDNPGQAVFRGCVGSYLNGTINEQRDMWIRMFIQAGETESEAIRIIDNDCARSADEVRSLTGKFR